MSKFDRGRVVYLNGKYVPKKRPKSQYLTQRQYLETWFEMTRSFNKAI